MRSSSFLDREKERAALDGRLEQGISPLRAESGDAFPGSRVIRDDREDLSRIKLVHGHLDHDRRPGLNQTFDIKGLIRMCHEQTLHGHRPCLLLINRGVVHPLCSKGGAKAITIR